MIREETFNSTIEAKEFINKSFLKSTKRKWKKVIYEKFSVDGVDYDTQAEYYEALGTVEPEEEVTLEVPVEEAVVEQIEKTETLEEATWELEKKDSQKDTKIKELEVENKNLKERLDVVVIEIPYFQQACQLVLFLKENTKSYPNTMKSFREQDDLLIANNSYEGKSEGEKAKLLSDKVIEDLKLNV